MSNYNQKSFEQCAFNPMIEGNITAHYPALTEVIPEELQGGSDTEKIVRYTIMVYDPKSPLVIAERDLNFRKGIAAELSGMDMDDTYYIDNIFSCCLPGLVDLTCKYLVRFAKSKEWAAICAYEYKFWEAIRLIMAPISQDKSDKEQLDAANKKDVLSTSIDEGLVKLEQYYRNFFGEDDELQKRAKKRMTPELMAERNK